MSFPVFFPTHKLTNGPALGPKAVRLVDQQFDRRKSPDNSVSHSFEQLLGQVERQLDKKMGRFRST